MRKILVPGIALLILFSLLSCSDQEISETSGDPADMEPNITEQTVIGTENSPEENEIVVNSAMTLSNNDLNPFNGMQQFLRVRMVKGQYSEDWNPGAFMGPLWEGEFVIELSDEFGTIIAKTDLSQFYKEPLIFQSAFDLQFDDYNQDGDLDFTLGQYSSSNGNEYKIFTLKKDGSVEELSVKGYPALFISMPTDCYSTKLTKEDGAAFSRQYYDNTKGKLVKDIFQWDGTQFVQDENLK